MAIFEFLTDGFSLLFTPTSSSEKRKWRFERSLRALLFAGGLWCYIEFQLMLPLGSPYLVSVIYLTASFACAVLLLLGLFYAGVMASFKPLNFVLLLLALSLNLAAAMSCLNRNSGYPFLPPTIAGATKAAS